MNTTTDAAEVPPPIDFDRASLTWTTRDGSHGLWRLVASAIARPRNGGWQDRVMLAPMVMAGDVYGAGRLPHDPPYSYQFIASVREHAIVREYCDGGRSGDTAAGNVGTFSSLAIHTPALAARRLEPSESAADGAIWPLTGRIDAIAPDGVRWLIDFPVNHLNSRTVRGTAEFQVETGPVLIPESLAGDGDPAIPGGFALAFLFFNRLDRVDLAVYAQPAAAPAGRAFRRFGRIEAATITLFARV